MADGHDGPNSFLTTAIATMVASLSYQQKFKFEKWFVHFKSLTIFGSSKKKGIHRESNVSLNNLVSK